MAPKMVIKLGIERARGSQTGDTDQGRTIDGRHEDEHKFATTYIVDLLHQREVGVKLSVVSRVIPTDIHMSVV